MSAPKRIQRQRTKGWRIPEGAVYVGRPSKWGNPFEAGKFLILTGPKAGQRMSRADAVESFRNTLMASKGNMGRRAEQLRASVRDELSGRDLACWCPLDQPCHADVLLELANRSAS